MNLVLADVEAGIRAGPGDRLRLAVDTSRLFFDPVSGESLSRSAPAA